MALDIVRTKITPFAEWKPEVRHWLLLTAAFLTLSNDGHGAANDIPSVVARASSTLASKDPKRIASLVGNVGVHIAPYGGDADNPGHNNGTAFAKEFRSLLAETKPRCMGYNYNKVDKILVFFRAPGIDWSKSKLKNVPTDQLALHFYKSPKSNTAWQLIWVTPMTPEDIDAYFKLTPCDQPGK